MTLINVLGIAFLIGNYKSFVREAKIIVNNPLKVLLIPRTIANCLMCCSFWVGLILTSDIPLSGFISLVAFCIDKYLISTPIKL